MSPRRPGRSPDPVRITTAARSRNEDIAARQRRYIFSMSLRVVCFVGAILVGQGAFFWVLLAGAIFLPYIAVILANAGPGRSVEPGLRTVTPVRRELGGSGPGNAPGTARSEAS
ncbi:DUF3099 domain-containing protein [Nocardioides donggukensis]|uniref:DUF3099 domain-containing protein n=1 Tax=Nocardioides donggukensis TaxID=2774019 RepID=A0A927Q0X0_9ACTN|nr:DUF3099 domain-containing protein [Nocardioides donggukensis]MBD8869417.1 DUF3099 domain-containing protein [Nocardioides donggukensis]